LLSIFLNTKGAKNMSIKEIADSLNFPNASFFGKFVKLHTGMTPIEYRLSKEEEA
jgi:YesN/AraC family two-component response regulator